MKLVFLISLIFFFSNCSKPKTVLICGDHVCVNKAEAEQYFEENLSIEVKIVNKKSDNFTCIDRKLMTGASPLAANELGKLAANTLLQN